MPRLLDVLLKRLAAHVAPLVAERLGAIFGPALQDHIDRAVLPQMRDQLLPEVREQAEAALSTKFIDQACAVIAANMAERIATTASDLLQREIIAKPLLGSELYLPNAIGVPAETDVRMPACSRARPYMAASVPLARDFLHPKFVEFARLYGLPLVLHRKHWEWAYIYECFARLGLLVPGNRGLGFGVGRELLPALFARSGVTVTATDNPSDDMNWGEANQYGGTRDALFAPHIIDRGRFDQLVTFEPCDMTRLPAYLSGYDFCWSSCCFEHLGDLKKGLDFVLESVESCLTVGGVACHTTEFNLSSDEATIEVGRDVIYRKRDLLQLCAILEDRGHHVEPLRIEPGNLVPDFLVDLWPYRLNPHLKLRIGDFVATSIALVIRRGR